MKQLILLIFMLFSTELLLAQITDTTIYKPSEVDELPRPNSKVSEIAEQPRPYFEECEQLTNADKRSGCATRKLFKYLGENVKYPASTREIGVKETIYVNFLVNIDGTLSDIKILREADESLGEECIRVIKLLYEQGIDWIPAKSSQGEPTPGRFTVPIKFERM